MPEDVIKKVAEAPANVLNNTIVTTAKLAGDIGTTTKLSKARDY